MALPSKWAAILRPEGVINMKLKILRAVKLANLPREICNHLHGEHHPVSHRMWCGLAVMAFGVFVAHTAAGLPHFIALTIDMVG